MRFLIIFLSLFIITKNVHSIDTKADQAIVVDFNTKEVLYEKNADELMPPASMTKIMTVYAAFDRLEKTNLSINDQCRVSATAYNMGGSRTFLEIDDQVSINELLKGIIVQSGNDASVALAECLAGTEKDFAILMNVYGKKLGMKNTNFVNSSGWPEKNHYSTVRDLSILSNAIINDFKVLYEYFKIKEFKYNNINQPNRNKLLSKVKGSDGLKTGYTKKSGWGISGSALRGERRITVVINGTNSSRSRLNESSNLLNWAFTQTSQNLLLKKNQIIKAVDVWLGNSPKVNLIIEKDVISILSFDQIQLIKTNINYNRPISAPIIKGQTLGTMNISIPGKQTIKVNLVAQESIADINPLFRIFAAFKYLIFGTSLDEI
jgi:D-alanyl-D-alanine carboxypeptidase (penicillin-binding protein 5/6)